MTLEEAQAKYPGAVGYKFGDNRALCDALLALVRAAKKTATCGALRDFGPGGEAPPVEGRIDIALDWDGKPALANRTVRVYQCRFCDMDEDFMLAEGENETADGWRRDHRIYFERNGGFDPQMMLICEYFEVVEDFAVAEGPCSTPS